MVWTFLLCTDPIPEAYAELLTLNNFSPEKVMFNRPSMHWGVGVWGGHGESADLRISLRYDTHMIDCR